MSAKLQAVVFNNFPESLFREEFEPKLEKHGIEVFRTFKPDRVHSSETGVAVAGADVVIVFKNLLSHPQFDAIKDVAKRHGKVAVPLDRQSSRWAELLRPVFASKEEQDGPPSPRRVVMDAPPAPRGMRKLPPLHAPLGDIAGVNLTPEPLEASPVISSVMVIHPPETIDLGMEPEQGYSTELDKVRAQLADAESLTKMYVEELEKVRNELEQLRQDPLGEVGRALKTLHKVGMLNDQELGSKLVALVLK